jgi:hypothetical protein
MRLVIGRNAAIMAALIAIFSGSSLVARTEADAV